MISTSIGYDTSVVCVLAVCEQVADPADPVRTCFDVVQLQYLNGLTHPQVVNNVALTLKRPPIPGSEFDLVVDETVIFGAGDAFKGLGKTRKRTIITAGNTATQDGFRWMLGRQVLLSKLTSALHQGELKIAKDLTGAPALEAAIREANAGATGVVDHSPCSSRQPLAFGMPTSGGVDLLARVIRESSMDTQNKRAFGHDAAQCPRSSWP